MTNPTTHEQGHGNAASGTVRRDSRRRRSDRELAEAIRLWAREQGLEVGRSGTLPPELIATYRRHNPRMDRTGERTDR